MTRTRIVSPLALGTAVLVAGLLQLSGLPRARAAGPAPAGIARVGDRVVDEADIRAAAAALWNDPLRRKAPASWRRKLLDRCVDRELLAREAERRGYRSDQAVRRRALDREFDVLMGEVYRRVLVPGVDPTEHLLDSLRASRLYLGVDLDYILFSASKLDEALQAVERLRQGARFDSTARRWSMHPSRAGGGHFGWVLARDLDARARPALAHAKAGDILGPYGGPYGIEVYGLRNLRELPADSLFRMVKEERRRGILRNYVSDLLRKYAFTIDTTQVNAYLFVAATEPVSRVLSTLGPDGTRPEDPDHQALGVLARVDGDSITFRDLALEDRPSWGEGEKIRLVDRDRLMERCNAILLRRLLPRDARDRGFDQNPAVARALRLIEEEESTRAMVAAESGGPPDSAALRAYFQANPARYLRPEAVRARAVCFDPDSAAQEEAALGSWLVAGAADSVFAAHGFRPQAPATATTLWPGRYGEITVLATDADSVALALRDLAPGGLSPAVRSVQGIVVAEALERDAPRPLTFQEAAARVRIDAATARESRWIESELRRLRSAARIQVAAARLARIKLGPEGSKKGSP